MKIAVYAIALNEAAHVERWARSAVDADYRIVVDTGSTDDTVERLAAEGVVVHRIAIRPWRFDDARNAALALVPADVEACVTMDMDEFLEPGWRPLLEAAWTPGTTALWCTRSQRARLDDPAPRTWGAKKVHARWGYRCRRPVHEALYFTGEREVARDCPGLVIAEIQDHAKTTRRQYLPLMELALEEDPNDCQICFWLGREHMYAGNQERAVQLLRRYLDMPSSRWADERSEAMRFLAKLLPDHKMSWLDRARVEAPHRRQVWHDLAEEYHHQGDWLGLLWACMNGLERTHPTGTYLDDHSGSEARLLDLGAIACWRLDIMERAVEWGGRALALVPGDERLKNNLDFFVRRRDERCGGAAVNMP